MTRYCTSCRRRSDGPEHYWTTDRVGAWLCLGCEISRLAESADSEEQTATLSAAAEVLYSLAFPRKLGE